MPTKGEYEGGPAYMRRCRQRQEREAKLRAKGIAPGSSKWYRLLYR